MDPVFKKIIMSLIPVIIFIGVAYVGYKLLIGTPAGAGLNKFLGGVGAVLGMAGAQLTTCATKGFFNVSGGCYLGVAGIAIGAVFIIGKGLQLFMQYRNNRLKYLAQKENKTQGEVAKDIIDKLGGVQKINNSVKDLAPDVAEAAVARAANNALSKMVEDSIATDPNSPGNIELQNMNKSEWSAANKSNNDGLDPQDAEEANDAGNELFSEPFAE